MIRKVQLEDLEEIMKIERQSFPVAWEYSIFLNICLQRGHIVTGKSRSLSMDVIEENDIVVGYAVWELDICKAEGHILNLAIQKDERRTGKGRMLLLHILDNLKTNSIHTCRLEVRENNIAARSLYEATGFVASGKISGYYFDENAIVYTMRL